MAIVDLPEAERPVNQTVQPFCLRRSLRSARVRPACQVMLLWTWSDLFIRVHFLLAGSWRGRFGCSCWDWDLRCHFDVGIELGNGAIEYLSHHNLGYLQAITTCVSRKPKTKLSACMAGPALADPWGSLGERSPEAAPVVGLVVSTSLALLAALPSMTNKPL